MVPQLVLVAVHGHVQLGPVVGAEAGQAVAGAGAVDGSSLVHPVRVLLHVLGQVGLLQIAGILIKDYRSPTSNPDNS